MSWFILGNLHIGANSVTNCLELKKRKDCMSTLTQVTNLTNASFATKLLLGKMQKKLMSGHTLVLNPFNADSASRLFHKKHIRSVMKEELTLELGITNAAIALNHF